MKTCKIQVEGLEHLLKTASSKKCIIVLWHNRLALVAYCLRSYAPQFNYSAFISSSRDGRPLAIFTKSYGGSVIFVSHKDRAGALRQAIKALKQGQILIATPDGPRGPLYRVKKGVIVAADASNASLVSFSWNANRFWELSTWDKFRIPKPFSRIQFFFSSPICLNEIPEEEKIVRVEECLNNPENNKESFNG